MIDALLEKILDFEDDNISFNDESLNDVTKIHDYVSKYKYFPTTKDELKDIVKTRISQNDECDLNDVDVS